MTTVNERPDNAMQRTALRAAADGRQGSQLSPWGLVAVNPQPMIAVRDVEATSAWYQRVLGFASGQGGNECEQRLSNRELVLQLHEWDAHEQPNLGDPSVRPQGNGVVLWFHGRSVVGAFEQAVAAGAEVLEPIKVNRMANHREFWLRDPNGYKVVVAGSDGGVG